MPRELLLPIPHHIADKVHHLLQDAADAATLRHEATAFLELADKLDALAREAGVMGW